MMLSACFAAQPDIEGMESFPGLQMHCHNYRHAELFQGSRVLVVGASFSGEVFVHLCLQGVSHARHSFQWTV